MTESFTCESCRDTFPLAFRYGPEYTWCAMCFDEYYAEYDDCQPTDCDD